MPPKDKTPLSPKSPRSPNAGQARTSLEGAFDGLVIGSNKGKERAREASGLSAASATSIRDSFAQQWPPSLDFGSSFHMDLDENPSMSSFTRSSLNQALRPSRSLQMSRDYRQPSDTWAKDPKVKDILLDKSADFEEVQVIMDDIFEHCENLQEYKEDAADFMVEEMIKMVYGSSRKAKRCSEMSLDETLKLCKQIFAGDAVEYNERTPEYQAKMEKIVCQGIDAAPDHVIRSRHEMIQHVAAFHYIVRRFVHERAPMTETLIKETHEILVAGISAGSAGVLSNKEHGGRYRTGKLFIGAQEAPSANRVSAAMASLVRQLEADMGKANREAALDPFALASKYCTLFVHIHPFQDANGRMCRLLLNAILIKYTGIVVSLGEHDQDRFEYTETARQSRAEGGHHGGLSTLVLQKAKDTLDRMRAKVIKRQF